MTEKFYRVNEKIKFSPVVVIDSGGQNLGPISLIRAKELAFSANLDLVEVSASSRPPVCKIMDFGKFKYEQEIKEKKIKQVQKQSQIKEIRLSCGIADHDMETKSRSAIKFLQNGNKVQVKLEFRRRENNHKEIGREVINRFINKVSDFGVLSKNPSMDGKFLICILESKSK
jgi:translation initiation factor IF-3